jgi:uncharacterized protein (DUF983 family)
MTKRKRSHPALTRGASLADEPPEESQERHASLMKAALACRCPRCGQGPLFQGLLEVRDSCEACGLDLRQHDSGDGPAVFVVFVLGIIVVGLAFWVDVRFSPPLWVHAILWPLVTVPLAIVLMRPTKAALVALQYHNRRSELGL